MFDIFSLKLEFNSNEYAFICFCENIYILLTVSHCDPQTWKRGTVISVFLNVFTNLNK